MSTDYIGALDIGGSKIAACVADASGPLLRLTEPTRLTGSESTVADQALALLRRVCAQLGIAPSKLQRLGVSACGAFVHGAAGIGVVAPNLCGGAGAQQMPNDWNMIPLEQVLRQQFADLVIENDCVAGLIGERRFGALQGEANCAYVTWSTGIGFGLCVDGHILRGKNGNAGHAGHMLLTENSNARCGCGNRGDLEALVAGRNLELRYGRLARELFREVDAGSEDAGIDNSAAERAIVAEAAQWFGRALYNLTTILDLRSFAIGGSVWNHHAAWLAPLVQREIADHFPLLTAGVSVQSAALGALVTDVGALTCVLPAEWVEPWRRKHPWSRLRV